MQALSLGVTAQQKEKWRLSPGWVAVPGRSSAPNHHLPRLLAPSRVRGGGRLRLLVCLEIPGASCLQPSYMYIITVASPSGGFDVMKRVASMTRNELCLARPPTPAASVAMAMLQGYVSAAVLRSPLSQPNKHGSPSFSPRCISHQPSACPAPSAWLGRGL